MAFGSDSSPGIFATTHWSVVLTAGERVSSESSHALETLCRVYWPPLYAFLRREGQSAHEAEDIVQGFFQRFLAKDYFREVSPDKGRFRSFLLASLRHYTANLRRDARTERRGGGLIPLDIDEPGVVARCEAALQTDHRPEVVFDCVWAETVMDTAARQLREDYFKDGKAKLYETIRVWLASEPRPGDYAAVAPSLDMSEGALAVAVHRLRQRFRQLIRAQIAHTVQSPADVDDEMSYLLEVLTVV